MVSEALTPSATTALTLTNVLYEKKGAIAYVTVNRPGVLNALDLLTWNDLRAAFESARHDAAVRGGKQGMETSQSEGLLRETSYFGLCAATADKKEGTLAFLEKRVPQFHGR